MTGNKNLFITLLRFERANVSFDDGEKCKIIECDNVGKKPSTIIENVYLVKGLNH